MPIYEYECKKCGKLSEYIQKFSDAPLTDCEECGAKGSLGKIMSLNSFHLKGSGWYLTDYARKNSQSTSTAPKKDDKNKTKETTKSTETTDTK
ncbi:MAG: zinc ribbon domain-containing protein [Deltaproteobacteria bacterium]|nr:zinc ribbon domain-containing protein [Deltaproteobacteria bacterium]